MNSAHAAKISALAQTLAHLNRRADEIQAVCQSQSAFPPLSAAVRICADLMAREVRGNLAAIADGISQLQKDGSGAVILRFISRGAAAKTHPDELLDGLLASYEHSLNGRCAQLNIAFGMVDDTLSLAGRPLPRGGLRDK